MRTDTGQVFRLEDYRPSDYLIPRTSLTFRLDPDATVVISRTDGRATARRLEEGAADP